MSSGNIEPYDWFKRFFGGSGGLAQYIDRKYRRVVDLPPEADTGTAKSNYKNGILEIIFNKKQESKPKGKGDKRRITENEAK